MPAEHQAEIVRAEYEAYARNALVQLRRVREGTQLEEDHMRNRQAIVHWLMANTDAISMRRARRQDLLRAGRAWSVPPAAWRDCCARCSASSRRATTPRRGRCSRPTACTSTPELRDEIVARVDRLKLPSYTGFVMPTLTPELGQTATITDVRISYSCNFAEQMLGYSEARRRG